ncbi:growth arrest and DNA damage-inducible s-interacting 1 [Brachionus plicatilis]|uniref:Large ribosomal subunit protein mL64 n=1 Tax=Brachionus plicatilis TaxID=10195 RepID=A0A3M7SU06_BRAPC|nr:growth arrest and DNA damage-inducible s-interacting 1 [Brachionus plicatilis]
MFLRPIRLRQGCLLSLKRYENTSAKEVDFKTDDSNEETLSEFGPNIPEAEEAMERAEKYRNYIESKRNVSRFSRITAHNKYKNTFPTYSDPEADFLKSDNYFRKLYAKFGKESGIDVGLAWPSRDQLQQIINEEKEYDLTLEQKINALIERKSEQLSSYEKLVKDTDDTLKKMPATIDSFYQRIVKRDKLDKEKEAKKQDVLDQAREFYGYEVDLRDPRIQEMIKKFQEERKVIEKAKKKEEEKKRAQAMQLQQKLKQADKILSQASDEKNN